MSILIQVKTRPNPVVELGAVDASCALLMCDLLRPDHPIVYASEAFEALTGYSQREILGRNCRFLQQAPPPPPPLPPSSRPQAPASPPPLVATRRHHSHRHQQHPHHLNPHNHHRISRSHSSATTTTRRRRTDNASGSGNSNDNGSSSSSSRDGIYDMKSIRRQLRHAIETNAELVVEIPNFRKDGRPFINFLTIIPVRWDGGNGGGATTTTPRYSVGFQVEKTW
ncbi:hypothetical protein SLS62_010485 [Diatrype stigma]|uniref:PAS domain-containing protein n=1 Tax=Diatrype stigma TaxID=117547 RepID=A0AAN9U9L2_9PEZI